MFAPIAQANWQYTRWGMNKDQVFLASNGALSPVSARRAGTPYVGLRGKYTAGEHAFKAAALFDEGDTLVGVALSQDLPRECARTLRDLRDKYGAGEELSSPREPLRLRWNDAASGNRITYDESGRSLSPEAGACTLVYGPLSNGVDGL